MSSTTSSVTLYFLTCFFLHCVLVDVSEILCKPPFTQHDTGCYLVMNSQNSWHQAEALCAAWGDDTHLMAPYTQQVWGDDTHLMAPDNQRA